MSKRSESPQETTAADPLKLGPYLRAQYPESKATKIKQWLKYGSVKVNGVVNTSYHYALRPSDKVELLSKAEAEIQRIRTEFRLDVRYEDKDIIVVNKPAGLLTMATDREKERTLYFEVTAYVRAQSAKKDARAWIVHRLDRESSGLVLFAKNVKTKEALQDQWATFTKKYQAVVEGRPAESSGTLRSFLAEDSFRRVYETREDKPGAKEAATRYRVVRSGARYSLLDLQLETGRKNQIRVQLSGAGTPIAGDAKYHASTDPLGRLALHAYYLQFLHPTDEKIRTIECPAPREFASLTRPA